MTTQWPFRLSRSTNGTLTLITTLSVAITPQGSVTVTWKVNTRHRTPGSGGTGGAVKLGVAVVAPVNLTNGPPV